MKIAIIVIYYDNADEIRNFIHEVKQQKNGREVDVILVVNKGDAQAALEIKNTESQDGPNIFVFDPQENLGYLNGFLYGYNKYIEIATSTPDWVILCNTDISFKGTDFFNPLYTNAYYPDDVGCVGPSVYNPEQRDYQNPGAVHRRSRSALTKRIFIFSIPILNSLYISLSGSKYKKRITVKPTSGYVRELHGVFFAFRNQFMQYFKDKTYPPFLYSEEIFVGEHIAKANFKTYYDADYEIDHNEHTVTGRSLKYKRKARYLRDSIKYNRDTFY